MPVNNAGIAVVHGGEDVKYDDEGNVLGSEPAPLSLPHHWAGWPEGVK